MVRKIGLFKKKNYAPSNTSFKMVTERGNGFYAWDGKNYNSDVVRACIRPKAKALGKMGIKHLRTGIDKDGKPKVQINPEAYMAFLLSDPNPYMTGQKLVEKMATQLALNNNAFALIVRDANGFPIELYPVNCVNYDSASKFLVSSSSDLTIKLWDLNNDYQCCKTLYGHEHNISYV